MGDGLLDANDTTAEESAAPGGVKVESGIVEWEYRIPLLTSRFMLWDFARVIVLSVLIMFVAVALMGWLVEGELVLLPWHALAITGGIMVGLFAIACLLLGNRFAMTFGVGPDGVGYTSGARERRWNRAAVIVGVLGGSPGAAGAGLLASSREQGGWSWAEIHHAVEHPHQRVITLRNSWRTVLRLHCTSENYEPVRAAVAEGIARGAAERARTTASGPARTRRPWHAYAAAVLVPVAAAVLTAAWPWFQYEGGTRWVVLSVFLLVTAGLLHGPVRGVAAIISLLPTGYVVYLTAAEMFSTIEGWTPGEVVYGWEFDTGLLAVTLAGEAILIALALWRLFGRDTAIGQHPSG